MLVEWHEGAWRAFLLGADGKRSIVNIAIPETISEAELVQYFDDIYHEAATPQRPTVVRLSRPTCPLHKRNNIARRGLTRRSSGRAVRGFDWRASARRAAHLIR